MLSPPLLSKALIASIALTICGFGLETAVADAILSPSGLRDLSSLLDNNLPGGLQTIVINNTMGSAGGEGASTRDENLFLQNFKSASNLNPGYVSGFTDFDDYLSGNPSHATGGAGSTGVWRSLTGTTTGDIDFDLGGTFTLNRVVVWNVANTQAIQDFRIFGSNDSTFATSTLLGDFSANQSTTGGSPNQLLDHNIFTFLAGSDEPFQFIRFRVDSNFGDNSLTSFAELAFAQTPASPFIVPEPSTLLATVTCVFWIGYRRRRRLGVSGSDLPS